MNKSPSDIVTKDVLLIGTACLALLVSILIANPFAASAFNDDFSYARVALDLATTGHFRYNGWGSPTIVFQSLWGALFIRVFGFSFNVLRAATIPFSLGFVVLSYLLAVAVGLRRNLAFFGTLTIALSPLFVPLAASFMTESYSCFFTLLCLYAAIKSIDSANPKTAMGWLWVVTAAGILGGSNRQSVWTAPLCLLPYVWWTRKQDKRFSIHATMAYVCCVAALLLVLTNFSPQYGPAQLPSRQWLRVIRSNGLLAFHEALSMFLEACALSFPAFLVAIPLWKRLTRLRLMTIAAGSCLVLAFLWFRLGRLTGLIPFLGNMLGPFGILHWQVNGLGRRPTILHLTERIPLTLLLLFSLAAWAVAASGSGWLKTTRSTTIKALLIYSFSYIPLLIPGALLGAVFDRYILPLLPLFVIVPLLRMQSLTVTIPKVAWASLAALAIFGVVITHDYAAELRARTEAASQAEQRGIPKNHLSTGLERDGWLQIADGRDIMTTLYGQPIKIANDHFWFWFYTTAIQPDYVGISGYPGDHLPGTILVVPFTAWTLPHQRTIALLRRGDIPKE